MVTGLGSYIRCGSGSLRLNGHSFAYLNFDGVQNLLFDRTFLIVITMREHVFHYF